MKKIFFLSVVLITLTLNAQYNYKFISKDLHLMTEKELIENEVQVTANTPMFNEAGKVIEPSQINNLMRSDDFIPLVYGNKEHKAKAIVFRELTAQEKKAKKDLVRNTQIVDPNVNFIAGKKASDFTAYDIAGNKVAFNDLKGKVVVLNFWFTTCEPCMAEIPKLNSLVEKYKDKVHFISITFDAKANVSSFLKETDFNYTHITDNEYILSDYEVEFFPTHIIINQKGEIILRKVGDFISEMDTKIGLLLR